MALPWAARRALLPVTVVLEWAVLALMIPLSVLGLLSAVVDRRVRLLRLAAMGAAYIVVEQAGLLLLLGAWLGRPWKGREWWDRANPAIITWALGLILKAARHTVGFRVWVEEPAGAGGVAADGREVGGVGGVGGVGAGGVAADRGAGGGLAWPWSDAEPVLALARHGGIGDSFTLVWLLAGRYGRRPRIVLKDILLWEPLIDVALTRMGACFLPPAGRRDQALETRVAAMAADLRPGDALLLFPEGGNWTPRRRHAAMARLWAARKPQAARQAALLEHVLPPRAGGVLACLDVRPDIPVVVIAHTGLDKVTTAGELWRALPFRAAMSVRWWPAVPAPASEDDRLAWLTREWAVVDQWIDARHPAGTP